MVALAAIMPLGIKLVYLQEFAHLNPLIPTQYLKLCKQVYRAFLQNEGKVRVDLRNILPESRRNGAM